MATQYVCDKCSKTSGYMMQHITAVKGARVSFSRDLCSDCNKKLEEFLGIDCDRITGKPLVAPGED